MPLSNQLIMWWQQQHQEKSYRYRSRASGKVHIKHQNKANVMSVTVAWMLVLYELVSTFKNCWASDYNLYKEWNPKWSALEAHPLKGSLFRACRNAFLPITFSLWCCHMIGWLDNGVNVQVLPVKWTVCISGY